MDATTLSDVAQAMRLRRTDPERIARVRTDLGIETAMYVAGLVAELDRMIGYQDEPESAYVPPAEAPKTDATLALALFHDYQRLRAARGRPCVE